MAQPLEDDDVSTRDVLESAFDQAEEESTESVEYTEEDDSETTAEAQEELDFEETEEDQTTEDSDLDEEDSDEDTARDGGLDEQEEISDDAEGSGPDDNDDSGDTGRAPVSWSPKVREHWDKLPAEVKAQVAKRETEVAQAMGESTRARRFTEAWEGMVAPYEPIIRAQGANSYQAVGRLLEIAGTLAVGSAPQKAQLIGDLVRQYEVDLVQLDGYLAGEQSPAFDPAIQQIIQQEVGPLKQQLQQYQQMGQQNQEAQYQAVEQEVNAFQAEFFEDVRGEMADLLEIASRHNRSLSLEDAYNQAIRMHPEINQVITQRERAKGSKGNSKAARRKSKAASSVRGKPSGGSESKGNDDLDIGSAIADAWGKVETRRSRV